MAKRRFWRSITIRAASPGATLNGTSTFGSAREGLVLGGPRLRLDAHLRDVDDGLARAGGAGCSSGDDGPQRAASMSTSGSSWQLSSTSGRSLVERHR